ncbi:MAG: hypothetical protein MUE41_17860 [Gemmatimonadaceae bacterium]|jgi:Tfp pilus assembly protein PilV|nr:hypothetical protein [Gemmatimonadaceae bacterium]
MAHSPRRRTGVSLIEVLVATVLLGGGVLCIIDATLRLARLHHEALARRDAMVGVARRAGERHRSGACASTGGRASGRGHVATWTAGGDSTRETIDEVVQLDARGATLRASQAVTCLP